MVKLEMNDNILYMDTSSVLPNKLLLNMLYGKFAMFVKEYNSGRYKVLKIKD